MDRLFRKFERFELSSSPASLQDPKGVRISPAPFFSLSVLENNRVRLLLLPVFRVKEEEEGRSGTLKVPEYFRCFGRFGSDRFWVRFGNVSGILVPDPDFFRPRPVSTRGFTFFRSVLGLRASSGRSRVPLLVPGSLTDEW